MEKKKHPSSWVRHKHCIFFPSSVNKTTESIGKPRSEHFSTQLNLGLERLRLREQHNPNKKPPCISPEREDLDSSVDPQKLPGGRSTAWKKAPTPCKGQAASPASPPLLPEEGRCGGNWGQHDAWGSQLWLPWSYMRRSCLNGNTQRLNTLGSKPLWISGHPYRVPIPC